MADFKNDLSPESGRRKFLKTALAGSLGGMITSTRPLAASTSRPLAEKEADLPEWVANVRRQIPAVHESLYFQTGAFGPSPHAVNERIKALLDLQNRGPADPRYLKVMAEAEDSCRPLIAHAFGADSEEVALTHNTTSGLNIVIWSIDWKAGDEIIISNQEHPALLLPTYNLEQRFGVRFRTASIDFRDDVVEQVLDQISPRTRLVALSHVSRESGRIIPAGELGRALHRRGIRLLLDGAQAPGNIPVNFHELGCDYYSLCGHKWLLGPKGTGALLIRRALLESTPVSWTGAHAQHSVDHEGNFDWKPDARRYEFATRSLAVFGGLAEALRWLEAIGWDKIHQRISALSRHAVESIKQSRKFQLVSPGEDASRNGIVVLKMPNGFIGREIYEKLGSRDHILVSPLQDPGNLRICIHFFNTEKEIDTLLTRLDAVCS